MTNNLKPLTRKEKILDGQNIKPINRDEYFIQKAVQSGGGGGGSSLPPYTSADKGKVLTVGEGSESETVVIVPEQTVTFENGVGLLSNVAISYNDLVLGDTATLTFTPDTTYTIPMTVSVIEEEGQEPILGYKSEDDVYVIFYNQRVGWVTLIGVADVPFAGNAIVSLTKSVPSVEPKWEAGGGIKVMKCYTGEIPRKTGGGEIDAQVTIWRFAASIAGNDINTFRAAVVDHSEYEKLTADDSVVIVDFSNGDLFFPVAAPSVFGRNELGASVTIGPPSDYLFESGTWLEPKEQSTITFAYFNPQIADIQSNSAVPVLIIDASAVVVEELST